MKTIILRSAIAFATVLNVGAASAAEPLAKANSNNAGIMERKLQHQIDKLVTYPLTARAGNMDGEVLVSFVIDTEGQVNVIRAESTNSALKEYVLSKLAKVDIGSNPDGLWKTTHMRFRFHPEA